MTRIFCAIDTRDEDRAFELIGFAGETGIGIKLGLEFFNTFGPQGVAKIRDLWPDLPLFLDLKLHDIPNTVAKSVAALLPLEPDYLNLHASGGAEMMREAAGVLAAASPSRTKLIGVTVLTTFDENGLHAIGQGMDISGQVMRLAELTQICRLSGVVCSPHEIQMLRQRMGSDFILITPGVRPSGSMTHDQKRVMTPKEAIDLGATHLVIGRPITEAPDPKGAIEDILNEIA